MADESADLLRQLLAVQKEILAELQAEAERTAQFRSEAVHHSKATQKKAGIYGALMLLIILGGIAYTFLCPWLNR